jgi:hypothetical protein
MTASRSGPGLEPPAGETLVQEYLLLGLRIGKLVEGFVDSWYGDPELSRQVDAEAPAAPVDLARGGGGREGRRLAGERIQFLEEVRTYFDVEIELGDPERYGEVHDAIDALLPGAGGCRAKTEAFYARNVVPPDRLGRAVQAVSDELRALTRPAFGLPDGERVEYEVVTGRPWNAFNRYEGAFRSTILLNAEAGRTIAAVPLLAVHEAYPGHHTEHCRKEAGLVGRLGHGEQLISLVNTPQCLMAEGTAELADRVIPGPGWGRWTADILAEMCVPVDGELMEPLVELVRRLMPVRQDAAIMLHDRGADVDDVTGYLERWLLLPRDRARQLARFLTDPLWRAYSVTYVEGRRLVSSWLEARPEGQSLAERYRILLDRPLRPSNLRAAG